MAHQKETLGLTCLFDILRDVKYLTQEITKCFSRDGIYEVKKIQHSLVLRAKEILQKIAEIVQVNEYKQGGMDIENEFSHYIRLLKDLLTGNKPFNKAIIDEFNSIESKVQDVVCILLNLICVETEREQQEPLIHRISVQITKVKESRAIFNNNPSQPASAPSAASRTLRSSSVRQLDSQKKAQSLQQPLNPPVIGPVKKKSFSEGRGPRWLGSPNANSATTNSNSISKPNPVKSTADDSSESVLKDKSLEVLKAMRTLIISAELEGDEIIAVKVKEFLKTVNELISIALGGVSGDWIHLFLEDQQAINESVHKLVLSAVENKFKGQQYKTENEQIVISVTTAIKNFLVSSDIFLEK